MEDTPIPKAGRASVNALRDYDEALIAASMMLSTVLVMKSQSPYRTP